MLKGFHRFPLQNLMLLLFRRLEGFAQQCSAAGVSHIQGEAINDEIVKGFQLGVPQSAC